jgi:hypothetical protein
MQNCTYHPLLLPNLNVQLATTSLVWSEPDKNYVHKPCVIVAAIVFGEKKIAIRKIYMGVYYLSFLSSNGKYAMRLSGANTDAARGMIAGFAESTADMCTTVHAVCRVHMDRDWDSWALALAEDWAAKLKTTVAKAKNTSQFKADLARRQNQFHALRACDGYDFTEGARILLQELLAARLHCFHRAVKFRLSGPGSNWFDRLYSQHGCFGNSVDNNAGESVQAMWNRVSGTKRGKGPRSLAQTTFIHTPASLAYCFQNHLHDINRQFNFQEHMGTIQMLQDAKSLQAHLSHSASNDQQLTLMYTADRDVAQRWVMAVAACYM